MNNYLAHYGVKGMKWGVRKDRTFTASKVRLTKDLVRSPGGTRYLDSSYDARRRKLEAKRKEELDANKSKQLKEASAALKKFGRLDEKTQHVEYDKHGAVVVKEGASKESKSTTDAKAEKKKFHLSDKQKKALGVAATTAAVAAIGYKTLTSKEAKKLVYKKMIDVVKKFGTEDVMKYHIDPIKPRGFENWPKSWQESWQRTSGNGYDYEKKMKAFKLKNGFRFGVELDDDDPIITIFKSGGDKTAQIRNPRYKGPKIGFAIEKFKDGQKIVKPRSERISKEGQELLDEIGRRGRELTDETRKKRR